MVFTGIGVFCERIAIFGGNGGFSAEGVIFLAGLALGGRVYRFSGNAPGFRAGQFTFVLERPVSRRGDLVSFWSARFPGGTIWFRFGAPGFRANLPSGGGGRHFFRGGCRSSAKPAANRRRLPLVGEGCRFGERRCGEKCCARPKTGNRLRFLRMLSAIF